MGGGSTRRSMVVRARRKRALKGERLEPSIIDFDPC
jgi:hypothetical protein